MRPILTCLSPGKVTTRRKRYSKHKNTDRHCIVTPGISALEYAHRRTKLAQSLPAGSIAILAASDVKYRSGAVFYPFHQDSDFLYLTGSAPK